jgi:hypothetical protein
VVNSASGNIAGVKRDLARVVEGGRSLLFSFSKQTHFAKSDPSFSNLYFVFP